MTAPNGQKRSVGLIIPVFNVEKTIAKVLNGIPLRFFEDISEILIIDNCSTDRTVPVVQEFLAANPEFASHVTLIQHGENYGYGGSIKAGFDYFLNSDVSYITIAHGDYQTDPAWQIGMLLDAAKQNPYADLVMASRFMSSSRTERYSFVRKLGNYFFNLMTRLCSGCKMSDAGTAIIIAKSDAMEKISYRNLSNTWQFHPQLNILLHNVPGIRVVETPLHWADSEATSTVPLIRYGLILLRMLALYWAKTNILGRSPERAFPQDPPRSDRRYTVLARAAHGTDAAQEAARLR